MVLSMVVLYSQLAPIILVSQDMSQIYIKLLRINLYTQIHRYSLCIKYLGARVQYNFYDISGKFKICIFFQRCFLYNVLQTNMHFKCFVDKEFVLYSKQ